MPIVIIFPGLTGSVKSSYIKHCILDIYKYGFRTVVFTNRGLEDTPLENNIYHGAHSVNDIKEAVDHIQKKYPNSKIYGIGISIGANFLTNYCGSERENSKIKGMVSISNPFDLTRTTDHLENQFNQLWGYYMASNQIKNIKRHLDIIKTHPNFIKCDLEKGLTARQPKVYDEHISRRLFGFESLQQYYDQSSSVQNIKNIKVPGLFINSKDDPIIHTSWLPIEEIKANSNCMIILTQTGGHIDYFTNRTASRWVYNPAAQFLQHVNNLQ